LLRHRDQSNVATPSFGLVRLEPCGPSPWPTNPFTSTVAILLYPLDLAVSSPLGLSRKRFQGVARVMLQRGVFVRRAPLDLTCLRPLGAAVAPEEPQVLRRTAPFSFPCSSMSFLRLPTMLTGFPRSRERRVPDHSLARGAPAKPLKSRCKASPAQNRRTLNGDLRLSASSSLYAT